VCINYADKTKWYNKVLLYPFIFHYYQIIRLLRWKYYPNIFILKRCCRCGIYILTLRCNHKNEIRCFFGCREIHKKKSAKARSKVHSNTKNGKTHKSIHNQNRYLDNPKPLPEETRSEHLLRKNKTIPSNASSILNDDVLIHTQTMFKILNGEKVSLSQIQTKISHIFKKWRQHRLALWSKISILIENKGYRWSKLQ